MEITATPVSRRTHAFRDLYEQGVTEASFLWLLRSTKLEQPQFTIKALGALETRLQDGLDGLMTSVPLAWQHSESALAFGEPGEQFTATVIALRAREVRCIQIAVEAALANERAIPGLISALGWLPTEIAQPWVERLLKGKDMNHKYLGVAACSVRREDPGELLRDILKRNDCRQHPALQARALRLVGELRRLDLVPALQAASTSSDSSIAFWANWSAILLGQKAAVQNLQAQIVQMGPFQGRALRLAFRVLPLGPAREWISAMVKDPAQTRAVIVAVGTLGDPHAVDWLIDRMVNPVLARLAGEAFTLITGIDLEKHKLTAAPSRNRMQIPNDNPDDADVGLDEDEGLPWPEVEKIAAWWRHHGQHFQAGRRYFLGNPITPDGLEQTIRAGTMRQRHAAAFELALLDPNRAYVNTRARIIA